MKPKGLYFRHDDPPGGGSDPDPGTAVQKELADLRSQYEALKAQAETEKANAHKSYTGLQQTLQKEKDAHEATRGLLTGLQTQFTDADTERTTLKTQLEELNTGLSERDIELDGLRLSKTRAQLIFGKFPELAPFEADGLLPEGSEDQLETLFQTFSEKLQGVASKAREDFSKGGTPPPPPPKDDAKAKTAQALLQAAQNAALKGDTAGYEENYLKYLEAAQQLT